MHINVSPEDQVSHMHRQVAYLEQQLSTQQQLARRFIAEQREDFTGRTYESPHGTADRV